MYQRVTAVFAASVSSLLLLHGGAAFGQTLDNVARAEQDGLDNATEINQSGLGNSAGTEDLPIIQDGFGNDLSIQQFGQQNQIGPTGNGLVQNNVLFGTAGVNTARIDQDGDENRVNEVFQQIDGVVSGNGNTLSISQTGGDRNRIDGVSQILFGGMPGQSADIIMEGSGNLITEISQTSLSDLRNEENEIFVLIRGSNNGTQALRGVAQLPGIASGRLIQTTGTEDTGANGNTMQLEIQAKDTAFGIVQRGRGNRTGPVVITGNGNAIGIDQDGLDNDLAVGLFEGADNEIGLSQYGTNRATLALLGTSNLNSVLIDQMGTNDATVVVEGDSSTLAVVQTYLGGLGGSNAAEVLVTGNSNAADVLQEGRDNTLFFRVDGSFNNRLRSSFSTADAPAGLTPGRFVQSGGNNSAEGTVLGDANLAAFLQQGTLNSIVLTMTGTDNEAILRQFGNGNAADLSQTGRANVAVFLQ